MSSMTMMKIKKQKLSKRKLDDDNDKKCILDQMTTLHGFRQFSSWKGVSSWAWLCFTLANFLGTIAFLVIAKQRLNSNIIVTKIYSDFPVNRVPFPAVSICNFNFVSVRETKTIYKILKDKGYSYEAENFFLDLPSLKYFVIKSAHIANDTKLLRMLQSHYYNVVTVMEDVHQKCKDLIIYCEFNKKRKRCEEIFRLTPTMEGHCCIFNYVAIIEDYDVLVPADPDFKYYYDQGTDTMEETRIITTAQSGRTSGLGVVFNVEPNDYPRDVQLVSYGAKILISDPNDYPETTVRYRYLHIGESMDLKVSPLVFQSDSNLRELPAHMRGMGCLFPEEVNLLNTNRYSYETCRTECKVANFVRVCGCAPYKYPNGGSRVCEFEDLPCLHNVTVYRSKFFKQCDPPCFLECRDKTYTMTSDLVPFSSKEWPEDVTKDRNISELASLRVYFAQPTCNCYKQSLLMDFNTGIATYGGMFSLSFGASLITFYEIAYLLVAWTIKKLKDSVYYRNGLKK